MVSNPDLLLGPIASTTGELADLDQIVSTDIDGNTDAQVIFNNFHARILRVEDQAIRFNFEVETTAPTSDRSLRFNDTTIEDVTFIYIDRPNGILDRADELYESLNSGTFVRVSTAGKVAWFETTGAVTGVGGSSGYYRIPVIHRRDQGMPFLDEDILSIDFYAPPNTALNTSFDDSSAVGLLSGAANVQTSLSRFDGTGIGSPTFRFSGPYSATSSNINEWFGGRQLVRMECTSNGGISPVTFDLPGSTALNTAFDQLSAAGLPEVIRFVISYTGSTETFLSIRPRSSPAPQIRGTTNIIVRSGIAAEIEISRTSGTISSYIFDSIGVTTASGGSTLDSIKLINPSVQTWDASTNGPLPTSSVIKGNAYKVVNAPSDGSGRFDEVMSDGDWVVWEGETFTSWSATPHQWFVLPAHEVRRISALESEFLNTVQLSTTSARNTIIRGADYADSAGEIRMKLYATPGDYSAADLNTTGQIDEFTDTSDQSAYLGIRLTGNFSALESTLPTLYVYAEDGSSNFTRLLNLHDDFAFQGDFGAESDYLSNNAINYNANDTLRIYVTTLESRYNSPDLDISESNLDTALQAKVNRSDPDGSDDRARLAALETKMNALFPLTPDVTDLVGWGDIYNTENATQTVTITSGYSLIADYRGDATRYESAGVTYSDAGTNVVRYTGLGDNLFRGFGFKVNAPADQVLMWIVDGATLIPFVDMVDTSGTGTFRVNNYTPATTEDQRVTNRTIAATVSGQTTLRAGSSDTATFTAADYPSNATQGSRIAQVGLEVLLNGSETQAEHLQDIDIPDDLTAQSAQNIDASIYLGPIYNNRTVNVTISFATRVSGSDLIVDVKLVSAPSDVTIAIRDTFTILNYTAPVTVARVDNFETLTDEGGNYEFTGETELLISFQPRQDLGFTSVVGAATTGGTVTQLNDRDVPFDAEQHFGSVEIPDQTALSGFEFRTFAPQHYLLHSDLAHLVTRNATQWCYGLAELRAVSEHSVSDPVDFTGGVVLLSPNSTRYLLTVDNSGTLKTQVVT